MYLMGLVKEVVKMNSHFSENTTVGILFSSNAIADTPQDKHKQLFWGNGVNSRIKKRRIA